MPNCTDAKDAKVSKPVVVKFMYDGKIMTRHGKILHLKVFNKPTVQVCEKIEIFLDEYLGVAQREVQFFEKPGEKYHQVSYVVNEKEWPILSKNLRTKKDVSWQYLGKQEEKKFQPLLNKSQLTGALGALGAVGVLGIVGVLLQGKTKESKRQSTNENKDSPDKKPKLEPKTIKIETEHDINTKTKNITQECQINTSKSQVTNSEEENEKFKLMNQDKPQLSERKIECDKCEELENKNEELEKINKELEKKNEELRSQFELTILTLFEEIHETNSEALLNSWETKMQQTDDQLQQTDDQLQQTNE